MEVKGNDILSVLPSTSLSVTDASGNFLKDADVASTCPLLTPSPPTNALVNPSAELEQTSPVIDGSELAEKLKKVEQGDASSSDSSVIAEPASIELLHNYLTCTKSAVDGITSQENGNRTTNIDVPYERKIENMCFFKWNWPIIRKCFILGSLSSIIGAVVLVVAMILTLPKTCNPPTKWYQGTLLYEIFPASFQDSNSDDMGDLKGLVMRADYIKSLGVRGIRLNSIFPATHYPENFHNVTTLFEIQHNLGTMYDFEKMIEIFHKKDIAVILDLPVWPLAINRQKSSILSFTEDDSTTTRINSENSTDDEVTVNPKEISDDFELVESESTITEALKFWLKKGVDGFYLKGLEKFVQDPYFAQSIREWKLLLGSERILIVNYEIFHIAPNYILDILLNRIDLVDVKLDFSNGVKGLRSQIEEMQQGILWLKPGAPWIQWSTGNVETRRLSSTLPTYNATAGALLLQMMLPGTPSIFYGDEIALGEVMDTNGERADLKHLHQLTTMFWENNKNQITQKSNLPWLPGKPEYVNFYFKDVISKMSQLRMENPSIYVNGIWKDSTVTCNAAVRYSGHNILVVERWYPRRNSFVIVSNLGNFTQTVDLSSIYYSGTVLVAVNFQLENAKINFNYIRLKSGDAIVLKLDK